MIPVEVRRLQDILSSFLGKPKNDLTDSYQLQYSCPHCIETKGEGERSKHNLEVNLAKGVFKCWSCAAEGEDMQGTIKKLILRYGSSNLLKEYNDVMKDIIESQLYELRDFKTSFIENNKEVIHLPKTYTAIPDLNKCRDKKAKAYLQKRHFTQEIINRFHIGYTTWDEESFADKQRIIIPSYDTFGNLNYWVGRDYSGYDKKTKYKNCKADKEAIIFQESKINFDAPITLVEGAIDALYFPNTISLLGKVLTPNNEIYKRITKYANSEIYICLDGDTDINETKRIYKILDKGRLRGKIHYIRLGTPDIPYKDYGEIFESEGKKGLIKAMKSAKTFEEADLVF